MNFLAHIFLSGSHPDIILGNFMSDVIKGKSYTEYPIEIQKGILLHREIDTFTDSHPIVKKSTKRLHKTYSHYSGVIVDIFYDHFLAKNWEQYSAIPLEKYAEDFYRLLRENYHVLPPKIQHMTHYMIEGNWLVSYKTISGIEEVLYNMNVRTKNISKMNLAVNELRLFYEDFENEFVAFFEEIIPFCNQKIESLSKKLTKQGL